MSSNFSRSAIDAAALDSLDVALKLAAKIRISEAEDETRYFVQGSATRAIHLSSRVRAFTFLGFVGQNTSRSPQEQGLRARGWLLILLFAHVMLHPWVHAIGMDETASPAATLCNSPTPSTALAACDRCELCRVGHNATIASQLPRTDLLSPDWVHIALQAVNYASLQADRPVPSRAPPAL